MAVSVSGVIDKFSSYGGANVDLFTREVPGTLLPPPPLLLFLLLVFWEGAVTDLPLARPSPRL